MGKIEALYGGIKACIVITSDNHVDIKHPHPKLPMRRLRLSLKDAQNALMPIDAYISVGDITSRGSAANWELVRQCFERHSPAKRIFIALGNHDAWNDDGYDAAVGLYLKNIREITGEAQDKTYFFTEINGNKLIFLGSSSEAGCEAALGVEEIAWFRSEMSSAENGKPVFVFCHQSLNGRHGLPRTWDEEEVPDRSPMEGGIGEESPQIEEILKSRRNVFFFSGHSHMGLCGEKTKREQGYASFESEDGLELINLPSLACGNHHGEDNSMCNGLVLEVYDDRVVIRPRSFSRRRYNKVIISGGKPYLLKKL